jgi:superfamily II DNA or RNA helicase
MEVKAEVPTALKTLIDNRTGNQVLDALRRLIHDSSSLDAATGYFEVGSLLDLDGDWQTLDHIRLLMGDEVTRKTRQLLVQSLSDSTRNGIERAKEQDDWRALDGLAAVREALFRKQIEARVYTKAKFHAKAYHFHTGGVADHGLIGSSNFTHPGLTQNLELNLFTSDSAQLGELARWYEQAWKEAEDIEADLLKIIEPHIREYLPFEVYVQAMREYFLGRETDNTGWEQTESRVFPLLAKYQKDAYYDLMAMANTHGGALLCDGVGLGKTFVALMLIERARMERHKVLVIAPKSAIPSVWARNLSILFPDDFGRFTDDIRVMAHTDFGRFGGVTEEELAKLRQRYETIIVDEAHHFRMPHRNRSRRLMALTKGRRLFMLTATPINNDVFDLYHLLNYIAQDRQKHFERLGVPNLQRWFSRARNEKVSERPELEFTSLPGYQEFLKHVIVQRSRRYVKSLETQDDEHVRFPVREKPEVIRYSLSDTYGKLLPDLLRAFDSEHARLKLVIYETERFKDQEHDPQTLNEQSQVVALVRTMLLKRLESSQQAFEASVEDLLMKHLTVLEQLQPMAFAYWKSQNADIFDELHRHRHERLDGGDAEEEEEDDLPLTSYEEKKLTQVKVDLKLFGKNEPEWYRGLEGDCNVLTEILRGLYAVIDPSTDAKLNAFVAKIQSTPRLRNDKIVVFSEFKDTARYLETELRKRLKVKEIVEVDSGRNVGNREKVIKRFAPYYNCDTPEDLAAALKEPIRVLVSTDVLSEGLNLQDANIIVNYDLHWNPVRLMQRIGRVDRRMDPTKPVNYDKVYVYNFIPPADLDRVLKLYRRVSGKLIAINKTLGIEAPVLTADDDFKAMDFYQNLGDSTMSPQERLRLVAHKLESDHPEVWAETETFPNRIYSGKPGGGSKLFLAYRVPVNYNAERPEERATYDLRWYMVDRSTGKVTEDVEDIHRAIACAEGTPRVVRIPKSERTAMRRKVEEQFLAAHRFRAGIPVAYRDELVCWMEVE